MIEKPLKRWPNLATGLQFIDDFATPTENSIVFPDMFGGLADLDILCISFSELRFSHAFDVTHAGHFAPHNLTLTA